jgi:DNA-nicking Smr family endonuclease
MNMGKIQDAGMQRPFEGLDRITRQAGIGAKPRRAAERPRLADEHRADETPVAASDEDLFRQAMHDVVRAGWSTGRLASEEPIRRPAASREHEDRKLMEDAVNGIPELPVHDHPEYIEGWVGVAGRRFLPGLRNGSYSIQGQVDLHGLSREEAREAVEGFIERMSRFRSCCVKIIHGRGINSPNDRAILKEQLQRWLSTRRLARHVVAYASAPFSDGGVGAVYVLLRRA